jgi:hypothetical protein
MIENLQKNSKGKGSAEECAQIQVGRINGIAEKNRNKRGVEKNAYRRCVEYSTVNCKVTTAFIIIFGMCRREGI